MWLRGKVDPARASHPCRQLASQAAIRPAAQNSYCVVLKKHDRLQPLLKVKIRKRTKMRTSTKHHEFWAVGRMAGWLAAAGMGGWLTRCQGGEVRTGRPASERSPEPRAAQIAPIPKPLNSTSRESSCSPFFSTVSEYERCRAAMCCVHAGAKCQISEPRPRRLFATRCCITQNVTPNLQSLIELPPITLNPVSEPATPTPPPRPKRS